MNDELKENCNDPARLWAEIFILRDELKGPKGFSTWKDAAIAERLRVQAAIDAALEAVAERIKCEVVTRGYDPEDVTLVYLGRDEGEIKAGMADKCYHLVKEFLGTNPLAEHDAQIAELEAQIVNQRAQIEGRHQYVGADYEFRLTACDARIAELEAQLAEARKLHQELLFAVVCKFPDETRHETALRYITEREKLTNGIAVTVNAGVMP